MGIKKNLLYNSILTTSGYLFPLLTYPYVSRILGVGNIGMCSFVDSIVNFFVLFSMMGIGSIGIRETAKHQNNPALLAKTFSELFVLTLFSTLLVLGIFILVADQVSRLRDYQTLLFIGGIKILFTPFLIEWFYAGIENFRYITLRSLVIKCIYTAAIFIGIKNAQDYPLYYALTISMVALGAFFNWTYKRKFVRLTFQHLSVRQHVKPFVIMGVYVLLTSLYTSFNVTYLGWIAGDTEVGYYTTATKLYTILLAMFTAFTGVMLPRISSLVAENQWEEIKRLIRKSFRILFIFCCPLIIFSIGLAPEIVEVISGKGYAGAILPMRIIMPLMLVIGTEQIFILQLLIPLKKDNYVLICSGIGATIGLTANLLLVPHYQSVGSAIVWVISEISILIIAGYFVHQIIQITFPYRQLFYQLLYSIPYALICYGSSLSGYASWIILLLAGTGCGIYFILLHIGLRKDPLFTRLWTYLSLS